MINVHHRDLTVAGLCTGGTFPNLLKGRARTDNVVLGPDGVSQLRAHLLILYVDFGLEVLDEREFYRRRHIGVTPGA
jgi:hypothetical protein